MLQQKFFLKYISHYGVLTEPTTDPKSISKVLSDPHCDDHRKPTRGRSVLSSLISEGSGSEPDQSQLERLKDTHQSQAFHMRISLGEEKFQGRGRTGGGAHGMLQLYKVERLQRVFYFRRGFACFWQEWYLSTVAGKL